MPLDRNTFLATTPDGLLLGIDYVKADGKAVKLNARRGVHGHLKGGERAWSAQDKGTVTLFDVNRQGYRDLRPERIKEIRCHGRVIYKAED